MCEKERKVGQGAGAWESEHKTKGKWGLIIYINGKRELQTYKLSKLGLDVRKICFNAL
jgi:hypothetical protein